MLIDVSRAAHAARGRGTAPVLLFVFLGVLIRTLSASHQRMGPLTFRLCRINTLGQNRRRGRRGVGAGLLVGRGGVG